ncbi:hypothetical protein M722_07390, partial [Neisseria gonorrhoeae ALB_2011_04_03]
IGVEFRDNLVQPHFGRFVHFVIRKPVFCRQVLTTLPDDRVCLFLTKE